MSESRAAGGHAMAAARVLRGAPRHAAFAAGQAAVVAHVAAHELGGTRAAPRPLVRGREQVVEGAALLGAIRQTHPTGPSLVTARLTTLYARRDRWAPAAIGRRPSASRLRATGDSSVA